MVKGGRDFKENMGTLEKYVSYTEGREYIW